MSCITSLCKQLFVYNKVTDLIAISGLLHDAKSRLHKLLTRLYLDKPREGGSGFMKPVLDLLREVVGDSESTSSTAAILGTVNSAAIRRKLARNFLAEVCSLATDASAHTLAVTCRVS